MPQLEEFQAEFGIMKTGYHGEVFEGNECNVILKNLDRLQEYVPEYLHEYVEALASFEDVKTGCFGYNLAGDYHRRIRTFELKMVVLKIKFNVTITPKCHILFDHSEQFIDETGKAIGKDSDAEMSSSFQ